MTTIYCCWRDREVKSGPAYTLKHGLNSDCFQKTWWRIPSEQGFSNSHVYFRYFRTERGYGVINHVECGLHSAWWIQSSRDNTDHLWSLNNFIFWNPMIPKLNTSLRYFLIKWSADVCEHQGLLSGWIGK